MDLLAGSTIAALCYARRTGFSFQDLATDLAKSLWETQDGGVRLDMPAPDFALCDLDSMRIGIARVETWREFPGSLTGKYYPECILVSVGPRDLADCPDPHAAPADADTVAARYGRIRQGLVARVQDVVAADRVLLYERLGSFDADMLDTLVDDIRAHLDEVLTPSRAPVFDEVQAAPAGFECDLVDVENEADGLDGALGGVLGGGRDGDGLNAVNAVQPEEMLQGLASRVERELARLEEARKVYEVAEASAERRLQRQHGMRLIVPRLFPGHEPKIIKLLSLPGLAGGATAAATAGGGGPAYPDYAHMPANVDERPLLHRAAVNALNIAVMTVALPVGAALLTMSVLGREDMLFSSRVTALTGTAIGISNTDLPQKFLSLFS